MKKYWILGLVAVAVVAAGITGGVAWAHRGGDGGPGKTTFTARVAEILGLEESAVKEAFEEAKRDIENEKFQSRMDRRVMRGSLSREEADAATEWYESRPDNMDQDRRSRKSHWRGREGSRGNRDSRFGSGRGFRGN